MIKFIKSFFSKKEEVQVAAPYKVEVPVAEPTPAAVQASQAMVESVVPVAKPAAKKPARAKKAPAAKKPRAPKQTKAK